MGKSGTRLDEKKQDLAFRRFARTVDSLTTVVLTAIRFGGVVLPFYFLYLTVAVLAGKSTSANIGIKMLTSLTMTETVGYGLGTAGVVYGLRERKLRRDKTEYLQERITKLERQLDPERSSSRLTTRGTTHPRDKE
jgi:hypothetical protein